MRSIGPRGEEILFSADRRVRRTTCVKTACGQGGCDDIIGRLVIRQPNLGPDGERELRERWFSDAESRREVAAWIDTYSFHEWHGVDAGLYAPPAVARQRSVDPLDLARPVVIDVSDDVTLEAYCAARHGARYIGSQELFRAAAASVQENQESVVAARGDATAVKGRVPVLAMRTTAT